MYTSRSAVPRTLVVQLTLSVEDMFKPENMIVLEDNSDYYRAREDGKAEPVVITERVQIPTGVPLQTTSKPGVHLGECQLIVTAAIVRLTLPPRALDKHSMELFPLVVKV
jgi:hypothetical protein